MAEKTETRAKGGSSKGFTLSMLAGLLVIPLSAVAALALVQRPLPEEKEPATTQSETQATVAQIVFDNLTATPEDLNAACGPAGLSLLVLEETATISPLQQAALDALRGVCEQQGTPLPGKPAPPTVTRTVRVNPPAPAALAPVAPAAITETTVTETTVAGAAETTTTSETKPEFTQERYLAVRAQAEAEIAKAEAGGGALDKNEEAKRILAEADRKLADGNIKEATIKCYEAIGKAREALGGGDD
jgi:hypothetical protein